MQSRRITALLNRWNAISSIIPIKGLRDKGSLFAFIGLHEDLSMGMLFILPGYRRRGWGERLERALTARVLAMGELPYGHVIEGNTVSMRLQQKIGFVPCSDKVFWMG